MLEAVQENLRRLTAAEDLLARLHLTESRQGSTWFGRLGDVAQQPPVWAGIAGVLALGGGDRGRRAALRGSVHWLIAAVAANLVMKPLVKRSRPPGAGKGRPGPITSSFPSGHTATDLAFTFGAATEIPFLLLPLSVATVSSHWSLVRSRGHYPTDVLGGGAVAVIVALVMWKLWPPKRPQDKARRRAEAEASRPT